MGINVKIFDWYSDFWKKNTSPFVLVFVYMIYFCGLTNYTVIQNALYIDINKMCPKTLFLPKYFSFSTIFSKKYLYLHKQTTEYVNNTVSDIKFFHRARVTRCFRTCSATQKRIN